MPNAKDAAIASNSTILLVGDTGSGKTSQIRSLPGKKFVYIFDPNALESLRGADIDYEQFLPNSLELDVTIKGFNKGSKSDTSPSKKEPTVYNDFVEDLTKKAEDGFFEPYDWICFDSMTFLQKSVMDRNMYLNNRFGGVEELSDYRIVGSKMSDLMRSITSEPKNILMTGHISEWQDELTKKISTQLNMSGQARTTIPLMCTDIWRTFAESEGDKRKYTIQTAPEKRGLQCLRSSMGDLKMFEDVTISDFSNAEEFGIGKLLKRSK